VSPRLKIYMLRHGEIEHSYLGRMIGQKDVPLSETGAKQARYWARVLADNPFERIWCSDLIRSRHTAETIGEMTRSPVESTNDLREISLGEWEGLTTAEIRSRFRRDWIARGQDLAKFRPVAGESFSDLSMRVVPVFERIIQESAEDVLIVGHAGVNRVILCHVLGIPLVNLFRLGQDYGALNMLERAHSTLIVSLMNRIPEE
jgi:alpha-ribazole phosphatase